jgi:hypothetical protein
MLLSKESVECSENPGIVKPDNLVWEFRSSDFPNSSWPHMTKMVYLVKQNANSNGGLNLNTQDEKPMFTNDKKHQQSTDINLAARTGGMS